MTLGDLLRLAESTAQSSETELADYRYVLSVLLKMSYGEMLLQKTKELDSHQGQAIQSAFSRLSEGFPPQYIVGTAWFYGLELIVNPSVLIPRPETEELVSLCLKNSSGVNRVLEIGTGSGAIAIALKKANPVWQIEATEISLEALELARKNASLHSVEIGFMHCDGFPESARAYDLIVSNPPYISELEYPSLPTKVKDHEPDLALLGGADGLAFYRLLLTRGLACLNPGGFLAVEHGWKQRQAITTLATGNGWKEVEAYRDLNGRDRFLLIRR